MEQFKLLKSYLKTRYECHDERSDLYAYFVERGHRLLAPGGRFGMIISNKFLRANYGSPLRRFLCSAYHIERVVDFAGLPVFRGATVRTIVLVSRRGAAVDNGPLYTPPPDNGVFARLAGGSYSVNDIVGARSFTVELPEDGSGWSFLPPDAAALLSRLQRTCTPLAEYCEGRIWMGVKSGLSDAFVIDAQTRDRLLTENPQAAEIIKPFIVGRDVRRYRVESSGKYLIYTFHGVDAARYPNVIQHLRPLRARLEKRVTRQAWYELQQPQYRFSAYMDAPKIVFPDIATGPRFALDTSGYYRSNTVYFIPMDDFFLLGLLNSAVSVFYFRNVCAGLEGANEVYLRFFGQFMEGFPVLDTSSSKATEKLRAKITEVAKSRVALEARVVASGSPTESERLQREARALDRQIDRLVYDLYGLTDEEIALVEESVPPV